jgi:hypothetical protein
VNGCDMMADRTGTSINREQNISPFVKINASVVAELCGKIVG